MCMGGIKYVSVRLHMAHGPWDAVESVVEVHVSLPMHVTEKTAEGVCVRGSLNGPRSMLYRANLGEKND